MRAIQIQQTGGPEVLELKELPIPQPAAGQVLVKIEACGVNFIDTYLREGRYPATLPFIPGQEAAGVVVEAGEGVSGFKPGDRVAWNGTRGTYAEYACAPASDLLHVPEGMSTEQAAAVLLQGLTAHYLSHSTYAIQSGDTVLVHAGAGGVGLLLTQMAKRLVCKGQGATVITTVSTEEKAELSRGAGADKVVLYTQESFADAVKAFTDGKGLPVVYDSVGKTTFEDSLKCLRPRGLLALYGASSGAVPPMDPIRLMAGSLYLTRPTLKDYVQTREELERRANEVFGWVASGKLSVRIGARYKLEDAAQAHRDLCGRKTTGKVLILP
ncbi:zinc-binding dehydrogenase [Granulicella sp. 5B5]|uniref:quinone oxidoreductase family protein n=1 Tax=Granulicella sp. 5B5 TaxID=1617967 RepID=UPI0015F47782|nr:quinone oxidoreductase [Granulicella sp. 5B5]QMV19553.1 zinc-binding dehydrogenase [Granulicella sp. 5B5]